MMLKNVLSAGCGVYYISSAVTCDIIHVDAAAAARASDHFSSTVLL